MEAVRRALHLGVFLAVLAAAGGCATPSSGVPALADAVSGERHVGKLVWVDLFTPEVEASQRFYADLFGWEWADVGERPGRYWIASLAGRPVAGLVHREPPPDSKVRAAWVGYVSTDDAEAVARGVTAGGGRTLVAPVQVGRRGVQAIFADAEGAIFGVLRSDAGDPADYRAELGDWIWAQLFSRDVMAAVGFYAGLFGYEVEDAAWTEGTGDRMLVAGGHARASVGPLRSDADAQPVWLGILRVADTAATAARVESLGGRILLAPRAGPEGGGLAAVIADPGGAAVGLLEWSYDDGAEGSP